MKSKIIEGLTKQLGMPVGSSFTLRNIAGKYTLTNDGIVKDGRLISQQELLHVLYNANFIKPKYELAYATVSHESKFKDLYPLFDMVVYEKLFKKYLFVDGNSAQDVIDIISVEWATEILSKEFNADCIAPYIGKALEQRDVDVNDMEEIFRYTLEYIFDEIISLDIVDTITFNHLVDYAVANHIDVSNEYIRSIVCEQMDYTSCSYKNALKELKGELK